MIREKFSKMLNSEKGESFNIEKKPRGKKAETGEQPSIENLQEVLNYIGKKSGEKPEVGRVKIGEREVPITHEDIKLEKFTERLNERGPIKLGEEESPKEELHVEDIESVWKEIDKAYKGEAEKTEEPYLEGSEYEEQAKAREEARVVNYEKGEEPEKAPESYSETQEEIQDRIKKARTEGGQKLNEGERQAMERDMLLDKLGYSIKYEGGLKGAMRGFFTGKEKARILREDGTPIEKGGKPVEFKANWMWRYPGEEMLGFLRGELGKSEEGEKEHGKEEPKESPKAEPSKEEVKPAPEEKYTNWQLKEDVAESTKPGSTTVRSYKKFEKPKRNLEEKKAPEKRWEGIDFKEMERKGAFAEIGKLSVEKDSSKIAEIIKKYRPAGFDLPADTEKLIRQYDYKSPDIFKFQYTKGGQETLKKWLALFLTDIRYKDRAEKLRKVELPGEKKQAEKKEFEAESILPKEEIIKRAKEYVDKIDKGGRSTVMPIILKQFLILEGMDRKKVNNMDANDLIDNSREYLYPEKAAEAEVKKQPKSTVKEVPEENEEDVPEDIPGGHKINEKEKRGKRIQTEKKKKKEAKE